MKFEIDEKTKKETLRCKRAFACLTGIGQDICRVEELIDRGVLGIKPQQKRPCHYNILIDGLFFCSCPIRDEIYRKYNL